MRAALACALLVACSDPSPPTPPPITSASEDGIRVTVGGREVVVHCMLACSAAESELTRLSRDCTSNPTSGPHRVAVGGALLTLGCCQEASLAYDRACGHEGLPGCAQAWQSRCEGTAPLAPEIGDGERGVTTDRGATR